MPSTAIFEQIKSGQLRLQDIPLEERDASYCRLAMRYSDDNPWPHIPDEYKSDETLGYWLAGSENDDLFKALPEENKTAGLLGYLIKRRWSFLEAFIGDFTAAIFSAEDKLIDEWVSACPWLFRHLSDDQQNYQRATTVVEKDYRRITDIPVHLVDADLCLIAAKSISALRDIPKIFHCDQLYREVAGHSVVRDPQDILLLPEKYLTEEVAQRLVMSDPYHLEFVPAKFITKQLCMDMLKGREYMGFMLNHIASLIPEEYREEVMQQADFIYHVQPGEIDNSF